MHRIKTLLDKINELHQHPNVHAIDVDLMLDYTRVLYADLLEWRSKLSFTESLPGQNEPSLEQIAIAMEHNPQTEENLPAATAPPVELGTDVTHYSNAADDAAERTSKSAPLPTNTDIRKSIGINDKYQFISELFSNNKEAYESVVDNINTFQTEEEALTWIHTAIFETYQWDEDHEAVQLFYKTLSDHFSAK